MRYGSICSGVEAASLAWQPLGWKPVFFAEVEPFPCAVLMQKFNATKPLRPLDPAHAHDAKEKKQRKNWIKQIKKFPAGGTIPNLGDFTKITKEDYDGEIDLLVGGSPCTSFSIAGLRKGLADPRGNLTLEFARLAHRIAARWIAWENVPYVKLRIRDIMESKSLCEVNPCKSTQFSPDTTIYLYIINDTLLVEPPKKETFIMGAMTSLERLLKKANSENLRLKYSERLRRAYRDEWKRVLKLANEKGIKEYSPDLAIQYLVFRCGRNVMNEQTLRPFERHARCAIKALDRLYAFGVIRRWHPKTHILNHPYKKIAEIYLADIKARLTESTLTMYTRHLHNFVCFLEGLGIRNYAKITSTTISKYCTSLFDRDSCTIHTYLCTLRSFLRFLYENEYHRLDLTLYIPKFRLHQEPHIPTTWTPDEVNRIIAAIDKANPIGKRDYAIILMVTTLGMRIGDVRDLQLDNLNWKEKKIEFIQGKNKQKQTLPLADELGWALIEYFKNGRPETNSRYVFVQHQSPYCNFSTHNSLWSVFKKYQRWAGIPHKRRGAMHSFRHTLASTLLKQGNPLSVISEILGHANQKSSQVYLKVDIDQLRNCCLSYGKEELGHDY